MLAYTQFPLSSLGGMRSSGSISSMGYTSRASEIVIRGKCLLYSVLPLSKMPAMMLPTMLTCSRPLRPLSAGCNRSPGTVFPRTSCDISCHKSVHRRVRENSHRKRKDEQMATSMRLLSTSQRWILPYQRRCWTTCRYRHVPHVMQYFQYPTVANVEDLER